MSNEAQGATPSVAEVRKRLHDVAQMLRESRPIDPAVHRALAELLDELSTALAAPNAPPAEVAKLADSTAYLAQSLHEQHDRGILERAREGVGVAMMQAEGHAPIAVGLARSLLDALANIGI